jgi:hypothetical protein
MSLAMTAELIDNIDTNESNSIIQRKKQTRSHNKTQKRIYANDINSEKVNAVLDSIHNKYNNDDDDDDDNYMGVYTKAKHSENFTPLNPLEKFTPPKNPISIGSERTKKNEEAFTNQSDDLVPKPLDNDDIELQELQSNFMNDNQVKEYYKKLMPQNNTTNKNPNNKLYYSNANLSNPNLSNNLGDNKILVDKLNYLINLLEEQQDQRTESVTEEIILYSFLGIFIIFIADSFVRVGKYTR